MNNTKISVLISNFNKESYIEECINSCLMQDYDNLEIIVIDNKSTDNSLKILKKFSKNIKIEVKDKISLIGAENQTDLLTHAFRISSGDLICLLDSDDYFMSKKIKTIEKVFAKDDKLKILFDIPRLYKNSKIKALKVKKRCSKYIWPTTIPTSGISLRRNFFDECLKISLFTNFPNVEIDFKLTSFSQKIDKNYYILDDYLTFYREVQDGIMANTKKFSKQWWLKRVQAHHFMQSIYKKNNMNYKKNYDYFLSQLVVRFFER